MNANQAKDLNNLIRHKVIESENAEEFVNEINTAVLNGYQVLGITNRAEWSENSGEWKKYFSATLIRQGLQ